MSQDASRIGKLILVPAVITLAVTLLRLVGELQGWSPALFNRGDKAWSPGLVGIVWLVPVFGAWFGSASTAIAYSLQVPLYRYTSRRTSKSAPAFRHKIDSESLVPVEKAMRLPPHAS